MQSNFRMVATFTVGLLIGGLIVGTIATSAMHAGKAKVAIECHETATLLSTGNDRIECPVHSSAEITYLTDTTSLVVCTCRLKDATSQMPQDDVDPEPIQPRPKLLEL